jgi:hypothetical protein
VVVWEELFAWSRELETSARERLLVRALMPSRSALELTAAAARAEERASVAILVRRVEEGGEKRDEGSF